MLTIKFVGDLQTKLVLRLGSLPNRVREVIGVKINAYLHQLASRIVRDKLSGQVLHRRTGILAGSVHANPIRIEAERIVGEVEAAGGPAFYGKIHEPGGSRAYQIMAVKARALHFVMGGRERFFKSVTRPPAMQRAFMRPAALEAATGLRAGLAQATKGTIDEK